MSQFIYIFTFILCLVQTQLPAVEDLTKKELWDSMEETVSHWTDALGKPIDPRIKDTVIVFNLLGYKTSQSCEGHLDYGLAFPWVDIDISNVEIRTLSDKITFCITQLERIDMDDTEALEQNFTNINQLWKELEIAIHKQVDPLHQLLKKYYSSYTPGYENMLILKPMSHTCRLQSNFAEHAVLLSPTEMLNKLLEYREEMATFTQFLKQHFFNS